MISNDEYAVDYQNQTITINSSNYIGENEFAIQISSVGYLTSDISNSVKARMITTSNDLDKVGDYIVWTPDKDATKYVLTFNKDGETKSTQTIHMSGVVVENDVVTSATVSYEVIDGENKRNEVNENVVKFENGKIMFKFTIPTIANHYLDLYDYSCVVRIVALSGGYDIEEAVELLAKNNKMIASFSRALLQDLNVHQTQEEFDQKLNDVIVKIYNASIT